MKRQPRLYSLYKRIRGTRRWTRISQVALKRHVAVRFWQDLLLSTGLGLTGTYEYRLKPVTEWKTAPKLTE